MNLPEEYILKMKSLLNEEYDEYIASFDNERLYGIRVNTLKMPVDEFYNKKKGYMIPEYFIYGKNRIPYIEFQAWFLYAFNILKSTL